MSEPFDPYRKWLGIPLADQPAHHYRLLGLAEFEDDADAIANAADRQMAHVRTFQSGKYSDLSQRLLNELAGARVCLLNASTKSAYDAQLRARLNRDRAAPPQVPQPIRAPSSGMSASPSPVLVSQPEALGFAPDASGAEPALFVTDRTASPQSSASARARARAPAWLLPVWILLVGGVVIVGLVFALRSRSQRARAARNQTTKRESLDSKTNGTSTGRDRSDVPRDENGTSVVPQLPDELTHPPDAGARAKEESQPPAADETEPPKNVQIRPIDPAEPPVLASGPMQDLLAQLAPSDSQEPREWRRDKQGITVQTDRPVWMLLPVELPAAYRVRLRIERTKGSGLFGLGLAVDGRRVLVVLGSGKDSRCGLAMLDGKSADDNETSVNVQGILATGKPANIECEVTRGRIRVVHERRAIIDWRGDAARLSLDQMWGVTNGQPLMLAAMDAGFQISLLQLEPLPSGDIAETDPSGVPGGGVPGGGVPGGGVPGGSVSGGSVPGGGVPGGGDPRRVVKLEARPASHVVEQRNPIPDAAERRKAEREFDKLFQADLKKAKSPKDRLDLARRMYDRARSKSDKLPLIYVLLNQASDLFAAAGEAPLACDAIQELARVFEVEAGPRKAEAIETGLGEALFPNQFFATSVGTLMLTETALADQNFQLARRFGTLASLGAKKTKNAELISYADRRMANVRALHDGYLRMVKAREKLQTTPDDPHAKLIVGKYLCLTIGDWQQGLPLLQESSDAAWAELATRELAEPTESLAQAALGDMWWNLAEPLAGNTKTELQLQGKYWYMHALDRLQGFDRLRLEERVNKLPGIAFSRLKPGLFGRLYKGINFVELQGARIDEELDFDVGAGPVDPLLGNRAVSIRWTGWLRTPLPGKYVFHPVSDDGVRIYINGRSIVESWHARGDRSRMGEVALMEPVNEITVEYYQDYGPAYLHLNWAIKDFTSEQLVPSQVLLHDPREGQRTR